MSASILEQFGRCLTIPAQVDLLVVPASGQDSGKCPSVGGSVERGDSGRKTRRPARFGTMAVAFREASVRHVRGGAAANIREAAFQRIVETRGRNAVRKALPWKREPRGLSFRRDAIQGIRICGV